MSATPTDGSHSLDVGSETREFILHVPPSYDGVQAAPLVMAFHGKGDLAQNLDGAHFQFQMTGGATNVLVYPQALPDPTLQNATSFERDIPDDLLFYDALAAWLSQNVCFDTARQFAIGHSLGSTFVQALACERPGVLRAIAMQAGDLGPTMGCQGSVAAWIGYGLQDSAGEVAASRARRDFWVAANQCDAAQMIPGNPAPPCLLYGCSPGAPVEWCEEPEGTHKWSPWMSQSVFDFFGTFVAP
jgi:polyhydroxybutyrate depolymerase